MNREHAHEYFADLWLRTNLSRCQSWHFDSHFWSKKWLFFTINSNLVSCLSHFDPVSYAVIISTFWTENISNKKQINLEWSVKTFELILVYFLKFKSSLNNYWFSGQIDPLTNVLGINHCTKRTRVKYTLEIK